MRFFFTLSRTAISEIEVRTEESPDIKEHSFQRRVDEHILDLGPVLGEIRDRFNRIVGRVLNRLKAQKVTFLSSSINAENIALWPVFQVWSIVFQASVCTTFTFHDGICNNSYLWVQYAVW